MQNLTAWCHFNGIDYIYLPTFGETNLIYWETKIGVGIKKERPLPSQGVPSLIGDIMHEMIKEYKATQDVNDN